MIALLSNHGLMQGLLTVLAFGSFVGLCVYAYSPSRLKTFAEAARAPLEEPASAEEKS